MKIILGIVTMLAMNSLIMLQAALNEQNYLSQNLLAITALIGAIGAVVSPIILAIINKKVNKVSKQVNGMTTEFIKVSVDKSKAEEKIKSIDEIAKEDAAFNKGKIETMEQNKKDEDLKSIPPDTKE